MDEGGFGNVILDSPVKPGNDEVGFLNSYFVDKNIVP